MFATPRLTTADVAALRVFAANRGRSWKEALRLCWAASSGYWQMPAPQSSEDAAALQSLRNSHGPSWLASFSLAKAA